jgi:hypothetical protein
MFSYTFPGQGIYVKYFSQYRAPNNPMPAILIGKTLEIQKDTVN